MTTMKKYLNTGQAVPRQKQEEGQQKYHQGSLPKEGTPSAGVTLVHPQAIVPGGSEGPHLPILSPRTLLA